MAKRGEREQRTAIDWYVKQAAAQAPDDSEAEAHMRAQAENYAQEHIHEVLQKYRSAHGTKAGDAPRIVRSR